jgi:hypothetical protein
MKILLYFFIWVCAFTPIFAQSSFKGTVDYGNYQYQYELNPSPKQKGRYNLKINISEDNKPAQLAYQSQASIEGALMQGNQYKISLFYAEKLGEQWKIDPTSHIEIIFDLADNLMKHSNRGIVAKFEAEELTDVLSRDLASESISEAQAVDYALQFMVLNYNQLFGNYAISDSEKKPVQQLRHNTIFVSANDAPSSLRDTISSKGKNYSFQLTETKPSHYSLEIKRITQGADIANEEIVYNSEVKVDDKTTNKDIYKVQIFYARGKGYTWRTTPQSFTQTEFNFHKKLIKWQVSGKLKEMQAGKFVPITKFGDRHQYTQKDMLGDVVRFFVQNFNKALSK